MTRTDYAGSRQSPGGGGGRDAGAGGAGQSGWRSDQAGRSRGGQQQLQRRGGGGIAGQDFSGRGPRDFQRAPDLIGDEVVLVLTADPDVDASDITVLVTDDGIVTLIGSVDDPDQSGRAEDLARGVPGVNDVRNQLGSSGGGGGGSGGAARGR
jgi:osmotically-inducible protein OsmY